MDGASAKTMQSTIRSVPNKHGAQGAVESARTDALDALLRKIARGEQAAMAPFYDATADRAFAVARSILRHAEDAEEAVFDAYSQVWQQANRFEPKRGTPLGWLTMIVRSRALDRMRRRTPPHESIDDSRYDSDAGSGIPGPDDLIDLLQEGSGVRQALAGLTATQRQVISLAYFRDYTHAEIATCLGLPIGTVKSHAHRGVKALRKQLDGAAQPAQNGRPESGNGHE